MHKYIGIIIILLSSTALVLGCVLGAVTSSIYWYGVPMALGLGGLGVEGMLEEMGKL